MSSYKSKGEEYRRTELRSAVSKTADKLYNTTKSIINEANTYISRVQQMGEKGRDSKVEQYICNRLDNLIETYKNLRKEDMVNKLQTLKKHLEKL